MKKIKAVIPAAGLGTRTLPATKAVPKELLPLGDRPGIQHIMEEILQAGIKEVGIVISKEKEAILEHFLDKRGLEKTLDKKGKLHLVESVRNLREKLNITAIYQDEPKGLGHAVLCAEEFANSSPIMVLLPDDIIFHPKGVTAQMVDISHRHPDCGIVALDEVPKERVSSYGIVSGIEIENKVLKLDKLIEKPKQEEAPSNLAITGRYLLPPDIFKILKTTKTGAIGEIQLTDALAELARQNRMLGYIFEGERVDLGTIHGFLWANIRFIQKNSKLAVEIEEKFGKLPLKTEEK